MTESLGWTKATPKGFSGDGGGNAIWGRKVSPSVQSFAVKRQAQVGTQVSFSPGSKSIDQFISHSSATFRKQPVGLFNIIAHYSVLQPRTTLSLGKVLADQLPYQLMLGLYHSIDFLAPFRDTPSYHATQKAHNDYDTTDERMICSLRLLEALMLVKLLDTFVAYGNHVRTGKQ